GSAPRVRCFSTPESSTGACAANLSRRALGDRRRRSRGEELKGPRFARFAAGGEVALEERYLARALYQHHSGGACTVPGRANEGASECAFPFQAHAGAGKFLVRGAVSIGQCLEEPRGQSFARPIEQLREGLLAALDLGPRRVEQVVAQAVDAWHDSGDFVADVRIVEKLAAGGDQEVESIINAALGTHAC